MPQRLHLVFGGELVDPQRTEFRDVADDRHRRDLSRLRHRLRGVEGARRRRRSTTPTRATSSPTCTGCATRSGPPGRPRSWASGPKRPADAAVRAPRSLLLRLYLAASRRGGGRGAARAASAGRPRGKEDGARLGERMGEAGLPRPEGRLVWFHAASVGEAASLLEMLRRLLQARPEAHLPRHHRHRDLGAVPRRPPARGLPAPVRAGGRAALGPRASSTTGGPTSRSGPRASSGRRCSARRTPAASRCS